MLDGHDTPDDEEDRLADHPDSLELTDFQKSKKKKSSRISETISIFLTLDH